VAESSRPTPQGRHEGEAAIIRGSDGSLYFIRQEILEACRVPEDLSKEIESSLAQGTGQGFRLETAELEPLAYVRGNVGASGLSSEVAGHMVSQDTYMCPTWIVWGGGGPGPASW
jgi:hypothetical protein